MTDSRGSVPVYLPDQTWVGEATVSGDGHDVHIHIPGSSPIGELISENLIGMSIVYLRSEARDQVAEHTEKEKQWLAAGAPQEALDLPSSIGEK